MEKLDLLLVLQSKSLRGNCNLKAFLNAVRGSSTLCTCFHIHFRGICRVTLYSVNASEYLHTY